MKYIVPTLLVVGVVVLVVFRSSSAEPSYELAAVENEEKATLGNFAPQMKQMGAVEVEVTPVTLVPGEPMVFDMSLDTHSVDLGYDYIDMVGVEDDRGTLYQATEWSGGSSGHHVSGTIEFGPMATDAQRVMLHVNGIDKQNSTWEWEL